MKKYTLTFLILVIITTLSACQFGNQTQDMEITVFTERHYDTDQIIYDRFTELTGIKVNLISDGADQLITRLQNEGKDTLADILIIADAGRLERAKSFDLFQPIESTILESNIPSNYQDVDHHWFGLTIRARIFAYHPDRIESSELSTYEDLVNPKWLGRIVTRTSTNIYNQSLMASMIEIMGEDEAKIWAAGLVANFARDPQGNDRDQAKAVLSGVADLAIMNTYYLGRMLYSSDPNEVLVAETLRVFFPNQETTGTHINVSGAGVIKHSKKSDLAILLLEYLSSAEAQSSYADGNFEYPVNPSVEPHALLASWGTFNTQNISLDALGKNSVKASILLNEVGWK
jgi:iron(III) transport system substrate-binding protein